MNAPGSTLPPELLITYDRPCSRCGYNLIGIAKSGQCPECGLAVLDSIGGKLLFRDAPAYLRRVARGALMLEVFTLGLWLTICVPPLALVLAMCSSCAWFVIAAPPPERLGTFDVAQLTRRVRAWAIAAALASVTAAYTSADVVGAGPMHGLLAVWYTRLIVLALAGLTLAGLLRAGSSLLVEVSVRLSDASLIRGSRRMVLQSPVWGAGLIAAPVMLTNIPAVSGGALWISCCILVAAAGWVTTTLLVTISTRFRMALWDELSTLPPRHPPAH